MTPNGEKAFLRMVGYTQIGKNKWSHEKYPPIRKHFLTKKFLINSTDPDCTYFEYVEDFILSGLNHDR